MEFVASLFAALAKPILASKRKVPLGFAPLGGPLGGHSKPCFWRGVRKGTSSKGTRAARGSLVCSTPAPDHNKIGSKYTKKHEESCFSDYRKMNTHPILYEIHCYEVVFIYPFPEIPRNIPPRTRRSISAVFSAIVACMFCCFRLRASASRRRASLWPSNARTGVGEKTLLQGRRPFGR